MNLYWRFTKFSETPVCSTAISTTAFLTRKTKVYEGQWQADKAHGQGMWGASVDLDPHIAIIGMPFWLFDPFHGANFTKMPPTCVFLTEMEQPKKKPPGQGTNTQMALAMKDNGRRTNSILLSTFKPQSVHVYVHTINIYIYYIIYMYIYGYIYMYVLTDVSKNS